ncbi:MAG: hypothetical protein ACE141_16210 [Bryobacteraceae bacterium]
MGGVSRKVCLAVAACGLSIWAGERAPTAEEQERFVAATREVVRGYARSLPDFICTQRIHRSSTTARSEDVLTVRLSYSSRGEEYKLVELNGVATDLPYEALRGFVTRGEFGSLLWGVFAPEAGGRFRFVRWDRFEGRRAAVYSYRVSLGDSGPYRIQWRDERTGEFRSADAGLNGLLFIDAGTGAILRITATATDIPRSFPVRKSTTAISYRYAEIGRRRYLLPSEAVTETSTAGTSHRNRVEFLNYSKFSADSSIHFEGEEGQEK